MIRPDFARVPQHESSMSLVEDTTALLGAEAVTGPTADSSMQSRLIEKMFGVAPIATESKRTLGHYELNHKIGAGGMGVVWSAHDVKLRRQVAIKLIHRHRVSERERLRLLDEARALAKLSHPNVVQVHEVGEHGDRDFVVMEFVQGKDLDHWQKTKRRLAETLAVYVQAGHGLAAAHRAGIIHRDFKPKNVLIGDDGRVRVADFGLAFNTIRWEEFDATVPTSARLPTHIAGTPGYIAPEVYAGKPPTESSDQFAFCVSLWEALCDERPFSDKHLRKGQLPSPSKFVGPRWLRRILLRGLALDPEARWPSVTELVQRIERTPLRRRWTAGGMTASCAGVMLAFLPSDPAMLCPDGSERFDRVWSAERRERLAALELSQGTYDAVKTEIERVRTEWIDTNLALCSRSSLVADRSIEACLDRALDQVDGFLGLFEREPETVEARLEPLLEHLESPADCLTRDQPSNVPFDKSIITHRRRIDEIRLGFLAGHVAQAEVDARALLEVMESHPFPGIRAEAQELLAEILIETRHPREAITHLREAMHSAEISEDDELLFRSRRLAAQAAIHAEELQLARIWLEDADIALTRLGDPSSLRAEYYYTASQFAENSGEFEDAEFLARRGLNLINGSPHMLQRLHLQLANILALRGRHEEAIAAYSWILDQQSRGLGSTHPSIGNTLFNIGVTWQELGQPHFAIGYLADTYMIQSSAYGKASPRLAPVLTVIAKTSLDFGNADTSIVYARKARDLAGFGDTGVEDNDILVLAESHTTRQEFSIALSYYDWYISLHPTSTDPRVAYNRAWLLCRLTHCKGSAEVLHAEFADLHPLNPEDLFDAHIINLLANIDIRENRAAKALERLSVFIADNGAIRTHGDLELDAETDWLITVAENLVEQPNHYSTSRIDTLLKHYNSSRHAGCTDIIADILRLAEAGSV
ncbi:protein kinase domain-containing protein [Nannocystaceae bacterium ST9]